MGGAFYMIITQPAILVLAKNWRFTYALHNPLTRTWKQIFSTCQLNFLKRNEIEYDK